MRIRTIRLYILMFAVGLSWGFMAKTFASTYLYIGYDDPQVIESADAYPIERLVEDDSDYDESFDESIQLEEVQDDINVDVSPQGTISI